MKKKTCFLLAISILVNLLPMHIASAAYDATFILSDQSVVITENGEYKISCLDPTSNTIYVANNLTDVVLDVEDLNIRHSAAYTTAPIEIGTGTSVELNFEGVNTIVAYDTAAIKIPEENSSITIGGSGSVKIIGGKYAAGIGADKGKTSGAITINSGTFDIYGGSRAAGIGGGYNGNGGSLTINGGDITVRSYDGGAGIGSGYGADNGETVINGGTVSAAGSDGGAGIGGGYRGKGGNIAINGGTVSAVSGKEGYAIGSGRYCVESAITIADDAEISAFSANGTAAVEEEGLSCSAVVFSGKFNGDFFKKDELFTFTGGTNVKNITFPAGNQEIFTTLPAVGDYTVSCTQGNLTYTNGSAKSDVFAITNEYNIFELRSFCACELTAPEFTVDDVIMSKTSKKQSISLSAKKAEFTRSDNCDEHKNSRPAITYTFSIIEDRAKIAELSGKRITFSVETPGTYTVVVRATATAGNVQSYTDTPITVTRQAVAEDIDDEDIENENIYIESNGVYNIDGDTEHNAIIVAGDLLDVTIVLNNAEIDLSSNAGTNKSPITIGSGSNVNISFTGSGNKLLAKKDADVINMVYDKNNDSPTTVTLRGAGKVTMTAKGEGACIGGGKNGEVYILDTNIKMLAIDAPAITCGKFFVSEDAEIDIKSESGKNPAINAGHFISVPYEGLEPGYLLQGVLSKSLDVSKSTTLTIKNSNTKKSVSVSAVSSDTSAFSTVLPSDGYYTCTYKTGSAGTAIYLTHEDNGEDYREFYINNVNTVVDFQHTKCKCKLSTPKFKVEAITLPYDQNRKNYSLNAEDAIFKLSDECSEHASARSADYRYSVIEDENGICSISGDKLRVEVYTPGKYKVKLRATAFVDGITASKDTSVTITKLTEEETVKQRGTEHVPYIYGYEDETFRPDANITRAEAASLLVNALDLNVKPSKTNLIDLFDDTAWYYDNVVFMEHSGYLSGYEDGSFKPNATMTRAEFCTLICKTQNLTSKSSKSKLTDLDGHWAAGYVSALIKKKAISGYEDNTFKPDAPITRAEAVTIINAVLERTPDPEKIKEAIPETDFTDLKRSHWAYKDIMEASTRHYEKELH